MSTELISTDTENSGKKFDKNVEDEDDEKLINDEYKTSVKNLWNGITKLPKNWDTMTKQEQREWSYIQIEKHFPNVPKSLAFIIVGSTVRGDCKRSPTAPKPDWLDHEKFLRGQKFARNYLGGVFFAELISLFGLFSFENSLKPIIITNKSSDPFTAFTRYLSTASRVKNWYETDPWIEGTKAYKDIQTVRKMHTIVRNKMIKLSNEEIDEKTKIHNAWSKNREILLNDFQNSCPVANFQQCPYVFSKDEQYKRPKAMNQGEMAATQSGFVALAILYPNNFGIHNASDDDLEAFCHVWRSIGYLLGMEDEFNFCNGSLEEVKQRSRDFIEYWVKPNLRNITPEWEHMLRCVITGFRYYFRHIPSWENCTLYFADLLDIRMPRLEASLSYRQRLSYKLLKISLQWTSRLPWVPQAMSRTVNLCMKRSLALSQEELEILRKRLSIIMSKDIEEIETKQDIFSSLTIWHKKSFFILLLISSTLLSFPLIGKKMPGISLIKYQSIA